MSSRKLDSSMTFGLNKLKSELKSVKTTYSNRILFYIKRNLIQISCSNSSRVNRESAAERVDSDLIL